MGLRYRRRVRAGKDTYLNVGSQKASVSLGKPGLTINASRRGVRATVGIPGTGLSYVTKQHGGTRRKGSLLEELFVAVVIVMVVGTVRLIISGIIALFEQVSRSDPGSQGVGESEVQGTAIRRAVASSQEVNQLRTTPLLERSTSSHSAPRTFLTTDYLFLGVVVASLVTAVLVCLLGSSPSFVASSSTSPMEPTRAQTPAKPNSSMEIPSVPALMTREKPPTDMPNYFDPKELGSAAGAMAGVCGELTKLRKDVTDEARTRFCLCSIDAARLNYRRSAKPTATKEQDAKCVKFSRTSSTVSPFEKTLAIKTTEILTMLTSCLESSPTELSREYSARLCACKTDMKIKNNIANPRDNSRCEIAARYAVTVGRNLTVRQFAELNADQ